MIETVKQIHAMLSYLFDINKPCKTFCQLPILDDKRGRRHYHFWECSEKIDCEHVTFKPNWNSSVKKDSTIKRLLAIKHVQIKTRQ